MVYVPTTPAVEADMAASGGAAAAPAHGRMGAPAQGGMKPDGTKVCRPACWMRTPPPAPHPAVGAGGASTELCITQSAGGDFPTTATDTIATYTVESL